MPLESSPIVKNKRVRHRHVPFLRTPLLTITMKLNCHLYFRLLLFFALIVAFFAFAHMNVNPHAQTKQHLPARTGYVNDFAGVVDETTRQRLEVILQNVKLRSGIEFDLVAVQTTGGQDIFDFSRQVAVDWDVGARRSKKSLLLVLSVDEKAVFTQFSRSVQGELPEGILGELSLRMRGAINSGKFSEGLSDGVQHFVNALAKKAGFTLQSIDQAPVATIAGSTATNSSPLEKATDEAGPVLARPVVKTSKSNDAKPNAARSTAGNKTRSVADDEDEAEQVELTLTLPLDKRVIKLQEFLQNHPDSKARSRAVELLISTHAGLGDQMLSKGDSKGGIDQLMLAISEAPDTTSEKLFSGVISQIPLNLYVRGQRAAAFEAAQLIEGKFGADAKRLLALTGFYLGIEQGDEAARLASQAVKLSPDLAEAHQALGLGLHLSLHLDEAAAEYKRALELDPNTKGSKGTRRSLADLYRAAGKTEEALALYREQLTTEPADKAARAGLVLSLLELGRTEEGNKELAAALQDDPRNLALLTGSSYWFAAHNQTERALELAKRSVELEPRYTWSQISLARALIGGRNPLEAERAIRFALQYGKFPTLDYELASVLASLGLYEEAAEALQQSFVLKDEQLEARLAGRVLTRAANFTELLAPERRASIFQFAAAETGNNAAMLKSLLSFAVATSQSGESTQSEEAAAVAAANEFAAGDDEMRVYRQLYAASRLLRRGIGLQTAYELTTAARSSVEAALGIPALTVAVQADEYREIRARAIAKGGTPDIPEAPRNVLANILRGRIEDLAGWARFNQNKPDEAVEHLQRAANILPEGTPSWRSALWHLGAAFEQAGQKDRALSNYIRSYNAGEPDAVRRGVIEQLYQKINGSLDGLDQRIGASMAASPSPDPTVEKPAEPAIPSASPESIPTASPELTPTAQPEATPSATPESTPSASPHLSPVVADPSPAAVPQAGARAAEPSSTTPEAANPTPEVTPETSPSPNKEPVREPGPLPSQESLQAMAARIRVTVKIAGRVKDANNNSIPNAVVVLISPRGTVLASTTDEQGNYSFIVSPSRLSYRIIPSKDGYSFEPLDKLLVGLSDDQKELDFMGAIKPTP